MRVATCLSSSLLCLPFLVLTTAPAAAQSPCGSYPQGAANYDCTCTGSESGSVWGTDIYTSDSNICVAARHAGVIGAGGGVVHVLGMGGLPGYRGSAQNGVNSSNWGGYHSSYTFDLNR